MSWARLHTASRLGHAAGPALLAAALVFSPTAEAEPASRPAQTNAALAEAFGQLPSLWAPSLSPDGSRVVMVTQPRKLDIPIAIVLHFESGTSKPVVASKKDKFDLTGCNWANDERLLCSFFGVGKRIGTRYPATRIVAADADGSELRVLMQARMGRKLEGTGAIAQFQADVTDWLPDDPEHVLIEEPDRQGTGLARLNVYTGALGRVKRARDHVYDWITDGSSQPRLRRKLKDEVVEWHHRAPDSSSWERLWRARAGEDTDDFTPIGFGDDPNRLISYRRVDGRMALVSEDVVGDGEREVLFAHERVDVSGVRVLGPHRRIVGATWHTERPHVTFFDPSLERVNAAVAMALPDKTIVIVSESWDRKKYLIFAYSDVDPGTWYRLDVHARELILIEHERPALQGIELSPMETIEHVAADGTRVPGYLTRPIHAPQGPLPTIVLPHGGPVSRDVWGFDWLAQFLATSGYVVFQTNYRGSYGYGGDWIGEGGFRAWEQALSDIDTGLQHLIDEGIADPKRVCAVGWSFGGYAALLSALEHPDRYRCVVDIAGVSDPGLLIKQYDDFVNAEWVEEQISRSSHVLERGSPLRRAREFDVPVLIFHPEEDLNVDVKQGRKLAKALRKADKQVDYVEYEDDEHSIRRHASRIDMLTRIGAFLTEHLEEPPGAGAD